MKRWIQQFSNCFQTCCARRCRSYSGQTLEILQSHDMAISSGLKPKGPNITPNRAKPNKSVQSTQARLKEARDTKGQENADNNVTGKNAGTSDGQSKDKRSKAK